MLGLDEHKDKKFNQTHDWKLKRLGKELEVGALISQGFNDHEVMKSAHVSAATLAIHKRNIIKKLH